MLGPDQPVILHLLDIPPAAQSLEGVKMELIDAALPLLAGQLLIDILSRLYSTCSESSLTSGNQHLQQSL